MGQKPKSDRQKILIADDNEMNRAILTDMLGEEYEIIEAEDGVQALAALGRLGSALSLVLLDIVMPNMDGYEVLTAMNKQHWIETIPVIMISAENRSAYIDRAYELGVSDFISRPFDTLVVRRRVVNTIMLYAKQKKLVRMVADQICEREKSSELMISVLGHVVEFRNGESGQHVRNIRTLTELLLDRLTQRTDRYRLTRREIGLIATASALHDIGKIAIPDAILNKPGKLTADEFEVMKTHTVMGASMLSEVTRFQGEPLLKTAYEICRWHHERYDGRGYPDGLKGDEIPISAQIVALADVYDALTSRRVYKKAYSHERSMEMILNGECGAFDPLILACLEEIADVIQRELNGDLADHRQQELRGTMEEMLRHDELSASERTLQLLERERSKYRFFADMSQEIQFEYTSSPSMLTVTEWGAAQLGLREIIMDPENSEELAAVVGRENISRIVSALRSTTPEDPVIQLECELMVDGQPRWHRITCRATWDGEREPQYIGAIGKAADIHDEHTRLADLRHMASHDALTGLWNRPHARRRIVRRLQREPEKKYALIMFDLDRFKDANDQHGHLFGDEVLRQVAQRLLRCIRSEDVGARIGGDEFLVFLEYQSGIEGIVERIFHALSGDYGPFSIFASMGVALSERDGNSYDELLHCADRALYAAKRDGRGQYRFYEPEQMKDMFSVLSPIDGADLDGGLPGSEEEADES